MSYTNYYYVYIYFDPSRDLEPFYVGKGKGNRCFHHLKRTDDDHPLSIRLEAMADEGIKPIIEKFVFDNEHQAFAVEAELIDSIGTKIDGNGPLLNLIRGHRNKFYSQAERIAKVKADIARHEQMQRNKNKMICYAQLKTGVWYEQRGMDEEYFWDRMAKKVFAQWINHHE